MGNPSISNGNVDPSQQYVVIFGGQGITVKSLEVLHPGYSSLSPSDQQQVINLLAASSPSLQPPMVISLSTRDLGALDTNWSVTQNSIISDMLKSWSDSVHAQAQRSQEVYNSPTHQRELERTSVSELSKSDNHNRVTEVQFTTGSDPSISISSPAEQLRLRLPNSDDITNLEVNPLAVTTVIGGGAAIYTTMAISTTPLVGVDPLKDAWNQIATPLMPDNSAAVLSQIGALMVKIVDFSNVQSIGQAVQSGKPVSDSKTASNFAENVIVAVNDPKFASFLQSMVISTMDPSKPLDMGQVSKHVAIGTAALLIRALAALNVVATSNYSGEEILKMIGGIIPPPQGDPGTPAAQMASLIAMINKQLKQIDPSDQASLLSNMANYIDTKPSITDLTMSGSVFRNALPSNPVEEDHLSEQPS